MTLDLSWRKWRSILSSAIIAGAALAVTPPALPQVDLETTSPTERRQPRFIIEAIGFVVLDESGPDWLGSDEAVTYFYNRRSDPLLAVTRKIGNVDDGDRHDYGDREKCILPRRVIRNVNAPEILQAPHDQWDCQPQGAPAPLEFTVTMYEDDSDSLLNIPNCFTGPPSEGHEIEGKDCKDDLIGQETISYTEAELLAMMPRVDNTFVGTVILSAPCGDNTNKVCGRPWTGPAYEFGYRITRLEDVVRQGPVLAPE